MIRNLYPQFGIELKEKEGEKISEEDLIREGYALNIFSIFGDDPYTIPAMILTKAWMRAIPTEKRHETHLWKYVRNAYEEMNNGYNLIDYMYRRVMRRLAERDVVKPLRIHGGRRPQYDYELTEYGEAVCGKLEKYLHEQIRLERWRKRAHAC
jgi:hypothetical protein